MIGFLSNKVNEYQSNRKFEKEKLKLNQPIEDVFHKYLLRLD